MSSGCSMADMAGDSAADIMSPLNGDVGGEQSERGSERILVH
jgi:hypothetical protein